MTAYTNTSFICVRLVIIWQKVFTGENDIMFKSKHAFSFMYLNKFSTIALNEFVNSQFLICML